VLSERDNPLRRWARLKQAAKAAEQTGDSLPGSDRVPQLTGTEMPFDPTSVPSIEAIAADTDITGFLRAGVPEELTRSALRKAWAKDPAIRDFIGIAENQWDFNDPDGIPGFGPLAPVGGGVDVRDYIATRLEQGRDPIQDSRGVSGPAASVSDQCRPQCATNVPCAPTSKQTDAVRAVQNSPPETAEERSRHSGALPS
jgi:hypothetical protein